MRYWRKIWIFLKVSSDVSGAGTHEKNYGPLRADDCIGFCWKRQVTSLKQGTQIEKKIGHFSCLNEIIHSTIALCIHVSLFKCYKTESSEWWCAEKPLQKCDNSLVYALYRHQKYSIPEEASLSGVSMLALFPHFQVKHSKKFK